MPGMILSIFQGEESLPPKTSFTGSVAAAAGCNGKQINAKRLIAMIKLMSEHLKA